MKKIGPQLLMVSTAFWATLVTPHAQEAKPSEASKKAAVEPPTASLIPPEETVAFVPPPMVYTTSRGGVDLQTGAYVANFDDLSVGGPHLNGGISLTRNYATNMLPPYNATPLAFGNYDHSLDIRVTRERIPDSRTPANWDWRAKVYIGTSVVSFRKAGGTPGGPYKLEGNNGTPDQALSDGLVYTDRNGTIYTFRGVTDSCSFTSCGYVESVVKLTGERLDFTYDTSPVRLRSVISNRGYAIAFDYSGTSKKPSKACAINLAGQYYNGTDACPAGARSVSYGYGTIPGYAGASFSYTNATGDLYAYNAAQFWQPGSTTAQLTLSFGNRLQNGENQWDVIRQDFADGDWITYSYLPFPGDPTENFTREKAIVTDPTGTITATYKGRYVIDGYETYYYVSAGPISVVDQLDRTTLYDFFVCTGDYCSIGQVKSETKPLGNSVEYLWAGPGALKERRQKAYPTGPADIVQSATYYAPGTAPTWALKFAPLTSTDANNNVTTYQYNNTTALLERVTRPVVGGVAPVTRYYYTSRYAWIKNSGGTYVQASQPILLLTEERTCKMSATVGDACQAGTSDEIVTTYDYGPDSGPNNLQLRGMVVDAGTGRLNLRTCYLYDANGNKIAETTPRGTGSTCP